MEQYALAVLVSGAAGATQRGPSLGLIALAPKDVFVNAGNTGMEPGKTSFFQALGIPTKIARGTIEIVSDIKVVTAGTRVGPSEATLLNMLNISPFTYGMTVVQIFDAGNAFSPEVLDIDDEELIGRFLSGIKTIAAISLHALMRHQSQRRISTRPVPAPIASRNSHAFSTEERK